MNNFENPENNLKIGEEINLNFIKQNGNVERKGAIFLGEIDGRYQFKPKVSKINCIERYIVNKTQLKVIDGEFYLVPLQYYIAEKSIEHPLSDKTLEEYIQESGQFGEPDLESQLAEAVRQEQFETAAELRDKLREGQK